MNRPEGLGDAGSALWADLVAGQDLRPSTASLALQACRLADQLDALHGQMLSGEFLRVVVDDLGEVELVVNKPVVQFRQSALALRQILASLGVAALPARKQERSFLDELAERRASRESAADAQ